MNQVPKLPILPARGGGLTDPIPVILFVYARPEHLKRALDCLRENAVPLIYAYADGAKGETDAKGVAEVRALLRGIDWADVRLVERPVNLGLGRNILSGVSEVAAEHEAFIVWEDDLIAVPGTYAWMCAALSHYATDARVMSATAWTHARVTPRDVVTEPYFDGRAECWVWGAWARSWRGMTDETAPEKLAAAVRRGLPADAYGADLPLMAAESGRSNTWAVRWLYHHLEQGGLCLRPPWPMVDHRGFDSTATNAATAGAWANPPLRPAPAPPANWPAPRENPQCRELWRAANPPLRFGLAGRVFRRLRRAWQKISPA